VEPVIADSARRHGITDAGILHAYRNPIRLETDDHNDDVIIAVGGDDTGRLIEIGFRYATDGTPVIFHAMPARPKYLD
jgi:hypothetical protein